MNGHRNLLGWAAFAAAYAALAAAPQWLERSVVLRAVEVAYVVSLAQLWNLLAGYAGLMSIGQQVFVGIGGYTFYIATIHGGMTAGGALLLAGAVSGLFAVPSAWLLFRLRGPQFAVGSWVLAESVMLVFSRMDSLGGASGLSLPAPLVRALAGSTDDRVRFIWWLALSLAFAVTWMVVRWLRSRQGLALTALRDNEAAAAGLGVDTLRVKRMVYGAVAAVTGCLGALIFLSKLRMSPAAAFSLGDWTAGVIFIVVIGGIGSIEGPFLGAFVYFVLQDFFAAWGAWYQLMLGTLAIAMMLWAPQGLWGLIAGRWGFAVWPTRRLLSPDGASPPSPRSGPPSN
jgi:branched-chain amino acid transport system permease protein